MTHEKMNDFTAVDLFNLRENYRKKQREIKLTRQILCDNCGTLFTPKRAWQIFCCTACRNAFHKAVIEQQFKMQGARIAALETINMELGKSLSELRAENRELKARLEKGE